MQGIADNRQTRRESRLIHQGEKVDRGTGKEYLRRQYIHIHDDDSTLTVMMTRLGT